MHFGESIREVWRATVTYFENQSHRMDYPRYVSKGWRIGSGPVESACKTVINQRLKKSGMQLGFGRLGRRRSSEGVIPE